MLSNIIIIALILLFMVIGAVRGLAKTLLNFAGFILTAITANYLSTVLSKWIYTTFLQQNIITNLTEMVQQNSASYAASNCFDAVPAWIRGIVDFFAGIFGGSMDSIVNNMTFSASSSSVAAAIEKPLGDVVTAVLGILLLLILFMVVFAVVKILIHFALRIFNIPVIRQINKFLGGILGIAEGIIFVFFAINIFYAIMSYTNPSILKLDAVTGDLFKFFCTFI